MANRRTVRSLERMRTERRLHLLDATYELFRAYFALPKEQSPQGQEIGGIRGLIGTVLKLVGEPGVTHLAAATDHVIDSFRNRLFEGYKTGDGLPRDLASQFSLAEEALRALGVVVWPMVEFEADDALATAAKRFAPQVDQVVILSPDKDLAQCVSGNRVVLRDRLRNRTYDEAGVRAKFGVDPGSIPDYLALVGDAADGIPGLRGWGAKSAATVLGAYQSVDRIPADPATWPVALRGVAKLAASLAAQRSQVLLYKRLATLRSDVPLQENFTDLLYRGADRPRYRALCAQHGLTGLADRPTRWAGS